jgi:hypothetical protein
MKTHQQKHMFQKWVYSLLWKTPRILCCRHNCMALPPSLVSRDRQALPT